MDRGKRRLRLCTWIGLWFAVGIVAAAAQTVPFPPPPATAVDAANAFGDRAWRIIRFNACSRELDYLDTRAAMSGGNFDGQGEGLTSILVAKLAWLRDPSRANRPCEATIARADLKRWEGPNSVAHCAVETGRAPDGDKVSLSVRVDPACMRSQVNETIRAMVKNAQLGTDGLPCATSLETGAKGDFDVNVRELTRILYMGRAQLRQPSLLDDATIDHMYKRLLSARGPPGPDSYSLVADCSEPAGEELGTPEDTADRHAWYNELLDGIGDAFSWFFSFNVKLAGSVLSSGLGLAAAPFLILAGEDPTQLILPHYDITVEETENHRLMIESARYLTNADIIDRLSAEGYSHVDDIRDDQNAVRDWLLRDLQRIAAGDFREYNARAYTRYSMNAIANLYDFADPKLRTAAGIVLDLSQAKFAAGSNRGRRIASFRRLEEHDGSDPGPEQNLYNYESGADHMLARALVLAGQTQLLRGGLPIVSIGDLVNTAVSAYRLPPPVLEVAVERRGPFAQRVRHAGVEAYAQSPAFTISAGGVPTPPTSSTLGFSRNADRGVAMPTVVIPTILGLTTADLFAFNGVGKQHERLANLCVWKGFACGIQPQLSAAMTACRNGSIGGDTATFFVNSAGCLPGPGPHFYLAAKIVDCPDSFCAHGRQWGILEIVEAPGAVADHDAAFDRFRAERAAALAGSVPDGAGNATYTTAAGEQIGYIVAESGPAIVTVNGAPAPGFATSGDVIEADGNGRATIRGPSGATVRIDFTDWTNPQRAP